MLGLFLSQVGRRFGVADDNNICGAGFGIFQMDQPIAVDLLHAGQLLITAVELFIAATQQVVERCRGDFLRLAETEPEQGAFGNGNLLEWRHGEPGKECGEAGVGRGVVNSLEKLPQRAMEEGPSGFAEQ